MLTATLFIFSTHERQNRLENEEMEIIILDLFEVNPRTSLQTVVGCKYSVGFVNKVLENVSLKHTRSHI